MIRICDRGFEARSIAVRPPEVSCMVPCSTSGPCSVNPSRPTFGHMSSTRGHPQMCSALENSTVSLRWVVASLSHEVVSFLETRDKVISRKVGASIVIIKQEIDRGTAYPSWYCTSKLFDPCSGSSNITCVSSLLPNEERVTSERPKGEYEWCAVNAIS